MTISTIRWQALTKLCRMRKGVGAEGSYVKSCIRHGEIRFAVLSCFIARRAIGICFFDGTFMIAFTRLSFFCVYT
ncbi:MAG TPA: hypothetical protein DCO93_05290 [Clostridiales bacterium]|nr:hypothetical protein [Clostridiales bacterium]